MKDVLKVVAVICLILVGIAAVDESGRSIVREEHWQTQLYTSVWGPNTHAGGNAKSGGCVLKHVALTADTANAIASVYDNTTGSGTELYQLRMATVGMSVSSDALNILASNGLYMSVVRGQGSVSWVED